MWKIDVKLWTDDRKGVRRTRQENLTMAEALSVSHAISTHPHLISFLVTRQREQPVSGDSNTGR